MQDTQKFFSLIAFLLSLLFLIPSSVQAKQLNNKEALEGLSEVRTVYDVRTTRPVALLSFLKGIEFNHKSLIEEGVKPSLRIVFISGAVQFISSKPSEDIEFNYSETLPKIKKQISRLINLGVKMEACARSTAAFKVDNDTLYPGIKPVRAGFVSLMGWQAQGYSLIPIY